MPRREVHSATFHPALVPGLEIVDLVSARAFPRHAHDEIGIGVLVAGAQRSWSDQGQIEAGTGDIITTNAGEMHDGIPFDGAPRCWRMAYLRPELLAAHLEQPALPEIVRPVIADAQLRGSLLLLLRRAASPNPERLAIEEALTHAAALLGARHCNREFRGGRQRFASLSEALARLQDQPEAPITLEELARLEGLSRFQLLRAFVRQIGVTPHAYQVQLRVRLARRLLAEGHPPAAVAAEAGFADQSHLNRVFRRQIGTTPGQYRRAVSLGPTERSQSSINAAAA